MTKEEYTPHSTKKIDFSSLKDGEEATFTCKISNPKLIGFFAEFEKENNCKTHNEALQLILTNYFLWKDKQSKDLKDFMDFIKLTMNKIIETQKITNTILTKEK